MIKYEKPKLYVHTCWGPGTYPSAQVNGVDYVLKSEFDSLHDLYVARKEQVEALGRQLDGVMADLSRTQEVSRLATASAEKLAAQVEQLEALLRELIDIEGPQPGHVTWARKVAAAIGATLETKDVG